MKLERITNKELDVMQILWASDKNLIASEIVAKDPALNVNTVQAALRKLLKKNYIKVADIVHSGTVLSRSYSPVVTREEYVNVFFPVSDENKMSFYMSLISREDDVDVLGKLSEAIDKRKKELEK